MEKQFATMFEDVRRERSLVLLPSLTDPHILKQSRFMDPELNITINLALQILYGQKSLKENVALQL